MNYIQLGKWLRQRRLDMGMTQKAVAEKAGVSRQWYNQFEKGETIMSKENLKERVDDYIISELSTLQERIDKALEIAEYYGHIDGDQHKMWVIDQMVRALTEAEYLKWVEDYCDRDWEWNTGVAP